MSKVILFSLVHETKFGGSTVYTAHLAKSFQAMGYEPVIVRVAKRRRHNKEFTHGLVLHDLLLEDAIDLAKQYPSIITYTHWGFMKRCEEITALLNLKVPIVIHDPVEYHDDLFDVIRSAGATVITVGLTTGIAVESFGCDVATIRHPYARSTATRHQRGELHHAVSVARLSFRKHQDIAVEANRLLPEHMRTHFYGDLDRRYGYFKLDKKYPEWREQFRGRFSIADGEAVRLVSGASWAMNLTIMEGDGNRTEYAILEAWDAERPCIIHKDWVTELYSPVMPGENVLAVDSAQELAETLSGEWRPDIVENALQELQKHHPSRIVPQYIKVMEDR